MVGPKGIPTALSFSGCGFLGLYHVGLIKCFQVHGSSILSNITKFGGASAGSLAAAVLAICPDKVPQCKKISLELAATVRKQRFGAFKSGFRLSSHVEKMVDSVLPDNAHETASGRVYLSITGKNNGKNYVISKYSSRADLIQCLVCSCHIPFYSGKEYPVFRGKKYYDGGFTNNLIDFPEEETLYVTPFSGGQSYLCPSDAISRFNITLNNQNFCINTENMRRGLQAMFPPNKEQLDRYYDQGFIDGMRYLAKLSEDHPEQFQLEPGGVNPRTRQRLLKSAKTPRVRANVTESSDESKKKKKAGNKKKLPKPTDSSSGNA